MSQIIITFRDYDQHETLDAHITRRDENHGMALPDKEFDFGSRLQARRQRAGLSQIGLARLMGWESQSRISMYETGKREPNHDELLRLCGHLRCTPNDLLCPSQDSVSERATPSPIAAIDVYKTLARLYSDLGVPMIDLEAMKRAYRAVEKLFARHPGHGPDVKAIALAAAYEETLRDEEAAERAVREALQKMQRSTEKKRSAKDAK